MFALPRLTYETLVTCGREVSAGARVGMALSLLQLTRGYASITSQWRWAGPPMKQSAQAQAQARRGQPPLPGKPPGDSAETGRAAELPWVTAAQPAVSDKGGRERRVSTDNSSDGSEIDFSSKKRSFHETPPSRPDPG